MVKNHETDFYETICSSYCICADVTYAPTICGSWFYICSQRIFVHIVKTSFSSLLCSWMDNCISMHEINIIV
jgi:hypothetical protein